MTYQLSDKKISKDKETCPVCNEKISMLWDKDITELSKYCIKCNVRYVVDNNIKDIPEGKDNELDEYRVQAPSRKVATSSKPSAKVDKEEKLIEWWSGYNWNANRYLRRLCFKNKWNKYTKFYLTDMLRLANMCDHYRKAHAYHLLEEIANYMNLEIHTRKEITKHKASISPRVRIGKLKYYLTKPLKM